MSSQITSILGKTIGVSLALGNKIAGHTISNLEDHKLNQGETIVAILKTNKGYFKIAIRKSKDPNSSLLHLTFRENTNQQSNFRPYTASSNSLSKLRTRIKNILSKNSRNLTKSSNKRAVRQPKILQANQYELLENAINSQDFQTILQLSKGFHFEQNSLTSILKKSHLSEIQKKSILALTSTQTRVSPRSRPIMNYQKRIEKTNNRNTVVQINI